jgi:hypothetical protein
MLAFVTIYLVMALGIGCIIEFDLDQSAKDRPIKAESAAIDLVTDVVQRSQ